MQISHVNEAYLVGVLAQCPGLKHLHVEGASELRSISRLAHPNLQALSLFGHSRLHKLGDFSQFPQLRSLLVDQCEIREFPALNCPKLK